MRVATKLKRALQGLFRFRPRFGREATLRRSWDDVLCESAGDVPYERR
jgi:hypothetical protein